MFCYTSFLASTSAPPADARSIDPDDGYWSNAIVSFIAIEVRAWAEAKKDVLKT